METRVLSHLIYFRSYQERDSENKLLKEIPCQFKARRKLNLDLKGKENAAAFKVAVSLIYLMSFFNGC